MYCHSNPPVGRLRPRLAVMKSLRVPRIGPISFTKVFRTVLCSSAKHEIRPMDSLWPTISSLTSFLTVDEGGARGALRTVRGEVRQRQANDELRQ